jgi:hypothetical protein
VVDLGYLVIKHQKTGFHLSRAESLQNRAMTPAVFLLKLRLRTNLKVDRGDCDLTLRACICMAYRSLRVLQFSLAQLDAGPVISACSDRSASSTKLSLVSAADNRVSAQSLCTLLSIRTLRVVRGDQPEIIAFERAVATCNCATESTC